jgi:hypothetical protein
MFGSNQLLAQQATARDLSGMTTRIGRLVVAPAMALAVLLGTSLPASAAVSSTNGGSASTYVACSRSMGLISITVTMTPQRGYASQSVAFNMYVQRSDGVGGWTGWVQGTTSGSVSRTDSMPSANFTIYVQYAWWNGSSWTYAGEWITSYTETFGEARLTQTYCAT